MSKYWSKLTHQLAPYVPGEQPQDAVYVKLNTNENPYPPSPLALQAIRDAAGDRLRLYPDPEAQQLKQSIADYYQCPVSQVFVGNGSDEVLALSFMAFFKDQPTISFPDITYSFYPVYCELLEIPYNCFELNEQFAIDIDRIDAQSGGIIFPNPNAPTGVLLELAQIETLLQRFSDRVVIVDEAYVDFGGESCASLVDRYPNLLVIQTLSKSRSLAGLRVGFALGQAPLIDGLDRVKNSFNSYPLDALAIAGARAAIEDRQHFRQCCDRIVKTRRWTEQQLTELGFQVLPSAANFVFASHPKQDAEQLYLALKQRQILVRYFKRDKIDRFLRITIGTDDEMEQLIAAIKDIFAGQ